MQNPSFGLAWDHGKRRAMAAFVAAFLALAVAVSLALSAGPASIEAGRKIIDVDGRKPAPTVDYKLSTMGSSWG